MLELPILDNKAQTERPKRPDWLKVRLPMGENYRNVRSIVDEFNLHTICQSGNCPNMGECWAPARPPL